MGKGCIKTRSTPASFAPITVKWTITLCHYPNAKFFCSMTKRRKGSTNKELLTWKWDRLPPWFLTWTEEWGNNANFSWATLRTNFPRTMASLMPVPYLGKNTHIFWNSMISPCMCSRVVNPFSQEWWLLRWF